MMQRKRNDVAKNRRCIEPCNENMNAGGRCRELLERNTQDFGQIKVMRVINYCVEMKLVITAKNII